VQKEVPTSPHWQKFNRTLQLWEEEQGTEAGIRIEERSFVEPFAWPAPNHSKKKPPPGFLCGRKNWCSVRWAHRVLARSLTAFLGFTRPVTLQLLLILIERASTTVQLSCPKFSILSLSLVCEILATFLSLTMIKKTARFEQSRKTLA
jgi:hypothetical protein